MILKLFSMLFLGAVGIWVAIPIGLAMKLNPYVVSLSTSCGAILGVYLILSVGKPLRKWYLDRYNKHKKTNRTDFISRIWQRYGPVGYGLLAPLVIGAHFGAVFGLILGISSRSLLIWLSVGAVFWCAIFTFLGTLGMAGVEKLV